MEKRHPTYRRTTGNRSLSPDKKAGSGQNPERLLGVLGVLFGLVALYFSWQANQIAQDANKANIIMLESVFTDSFFSGARNGVYTGCEIRMRLTNIGGATTSFVGYRVGVSVFDQLQELETTSSVAYARSLFGPGMSEVENHIYRIEGASPDPRFAEIQPGKPVEIAFPYPIESGVTIDLHTRLTFELNTKDPGIFVRDSTGPFVVSPDSGMFSTWFEDPAFREKIELFPLNASYVFLLASGQEVPAPETTCLFLQYFLS